jgi:hypothetical protein
MSQLFSHYELEIDIAKGLTLTWLEELTRAHRGNVFIAGAKYIITGWMNFAEP